MAIIQQEQAYEVESLARTYYTDGPFSEPFLSVTIVVLPDPADPTKIQQAELDINGIVPIFSNVPVTFDCKTLGKNVSNMQINKGTSPGVAVYWTKYRGFVWARES